MGLVSSTNRISFDAAAQEVTGNKWIIGIFWTSDEAGNRDIAADDDFLLVDSNDKRIAGKQAKFAGDDFGITIARPGLPVNGIKTSKMDGGVCDIWLA